MGIPEAILYEDGAEADRIHRIANLCEPPPDSDSATMANALIGAIPGIVDIRDDQERQQVIALAYKLSRALIGNELAGHFQYPPTRTFGTLFGFRLETAPPALAEERGWWSVRTISASFSRFPYMKRAA